MSIKECRPISLAGNIHKIISKVFSTTLKKVLDKIVPSSQNAFVEGRHIFYAILLAHEMVDCRRKKGASVFSAS